MISKSSFLLYFSVYLHLFDLFKVISRKQSYKANVVLFFFVRAAVFLSISSNPGEQQRPEPQSHPQPNTPLQVSSNQPCLKYSRNQEGLSSFWLQFVTDSPRSLLSVVDGARAQSTVSEPASWGQSSGKVRRWQTDWLAESHFLL